MQTCHKGHSLLVEGVDFTYQLSGMGHIYKQCRICNIERAKAWRASGTGKSQDHNKTDYSRANRLRST